MEVRQFFTELLAEKGDQEPFASDEPLFTSGRLQSMDGIRLAVFLEDRFGADFASLGFDQQKIDTIDSTCQLVDQVESGS